MIRNNVVLLVNGISVDIDDDTAIGITFNGFNFSDAGAIHLNYTNEFTLPITSTNRKVFSFPDIDGVNSLEVEPMFYKKQPFKLYIDGAFVFAGELYIKNVNSNRISVYLISDKDFFETLKSCTMLDVLEAIIDKLNSELDSVYTSGASFSEIVNYMKTGNNSVWLPYTVGTLNKCYPYAKLDTDTGVTSVGNKYDDSDDNEKYNLDKETVITTEFITDSEIVGDYKSGHLYVNLYKILYWFFSYKGYIIQFDTDVYNEITKQYLRVPDLVLYNDLLTNKYYFRIDTHSHYVIDDDGVASSTKQNFLDLVKAVINEYCLVFDISNENVISFHSFNNIKELEPMVFESEKTLTRKFDIDGISQKNYIGYSNTTDDSATSGALQIVCKNKNIEAGDDDNVIVSINKMLCGYFAYMYEDTDNVKKQTFALNTTDSSAVNNFIWVQRNETDTPYDVKVQRVMAYNADYTYTKLYRAYNSVVSNNGFWELFRKNCEYPEMIKVKARIKPYQLLNFSSFHLAKFKTITGTWYISQISEFNPRLDDGLVELVAVRIR